MAIWKKLVTTFYGGDENRVSGDLGIDDITAAEPEEEAQQRPGVFESVKETKYWWHLDLTGPAQGGPYPARLSGRGIVNVHIHYKQMDDAWDMIRRLELEIDHLKHLLKQQTEPRTSERPSIEPAARLLIPDLRHEDGIGLWHRDRNATEVILDRPVMRIGRGSDCDIQISHRSISRHHATIEYREGTYFLVDEESPDGVQVNGMLYQETPLENNDQIYFGHVCVYFATQDPPPEPS